MSDVNNRLKASAIVFGKLAACGATIAAIGFAVLTLSEGGEVASTSADISDFSLGDKPRERIFVETLERLGHNKPETFSLNGNVVHFSSTYAKGSPERIFEEYQRTLVEQGYNKRAHTAPSAENQKELIEAALLGDLIPVQVSPDQVIMGGASLRSGARSVKELLATVDEFPSTPDEWARLFDGHQWIEITRDDEYRDRSLVVSTWADDFNIKKMVPGNTEPDQNVDPEVPACPGCTQTLSFEKLSAGKQHRHVAYSNAIGTDAAMRYYTDAMTRRGWELTETSSMYIRLKEHMKFEGDDAHMLQFTKKDEFLTVLSYPENGKATVQIVRSD